MKRRKGFTLVEMIITIVILAIMMIPAALVALEYVRSMEYADSLTMAANLGRMEMGIVNSLSYFDPTLDFNYSALTTNYAGYNFDVRRMVGSTGIKKVSVIVYPRGSAKKLIELVTYVTAKSYGPGSAGGALGEEAGSFLASGGVLWVNQLSNVTLQNTRATGNITMKGVVITSWWTGLPIEVNSIVMGGEERIGSGSVTLPMGTPTLIYFQRNFIMNSNTSYSGADGGQFAFSISDFTWSVKVKFVFYDGSQSPEYTWTYTAPVGP